MNTERHTPLVLVVDDDEEFREDILPREFADLGVNILKAANMADGLRSATEHRLGSPSPLALIILDMHMPQDDIKIDIDTEAGIKTLQHFNRGCVPPVIVFTAHPSYANCVAAINAGAYDYLPKKQTEDEEGGIGQLKERCKELLFKPPAEAPVSTKPPSDKWSSMNYAWLCDRFPDQWVAFIEEDTARELGYGDTRSGCYRDGIYLLGDASLDTVRREVMSHDKLIIACPNIYGIPGRSDNDGEDTEEV